MKSSGFYPVQPLKKNIFGFLRFLSPAHLCIILFSGLLNKSIQQKQEMKCKKIRENLLDCMEFARDAYMLVKNNNLPQQVQSWMDDIFNILIFLLENINKLTSNSIIASYYSIKDIILKTKDITKNVTELTPLLDGLINLIDKGCCFEY
jgi:hypothetical protein